MRIVVTGASGFIGKRFAASLREAGHQVVTLGRGESADYRWDSSIDAPAEAFEGAGAVVHLAGEKVAQRWTAEAKQRIRDSRVLGTERLIHGLSITRNRPRVLVCGSAVGYYGDRGDDFLPEDATPGNGFLAQVCREWEAKADLGEALGMQVTKVRTGLVLGPDGGALKQMLTPFKLGVGGRLGNGRQWMPWIHLDDIVGIFRHAIDLSFQGILNGAAPGVATNADFTTALGKALHRPTAFPAPAFALKLMLGEMAGMVLASQRVVPRATQASGYRFQYSDLDAALASLTL
ncbi:MAG TPA: TIGR01777 family oxidoreductase [Bryobacteraceae bacterium]|jgi:hypothetical protein